MKVCNLYRAYQTRADDVFTFIIDVNSKFMIDMEGCRVGFGKFIFTAGEVRTYCMTEVPTHIPNMASANFEFAIVGDSSMINRILKTDISANLSLNFCIASPWEWYDIKDTQII